MNFEPLPKCCFGMFTVGIKHYMILFNLSCDILSHFKLLCPACLRTNIVAGTGLKTGG